MHSILYNFHKMKLVVNGLELQRFNLIPWLFYSFIDDDKVKDFN